MPSRVKDKNNTLVVKFYDDVSDKEVHEMLAWMGISGCRVSSLLKRWAIEVPYWKEREFAEKLYQKDIVESISNSFSKTKPTTEESEASYNQNEQTETE